MSDFDPWNTCANPARIRASAEGLRSISGVLLGHGDNVGEVLNEVALSFSEIIAVDVAAQIGNNTAALETAVEGTVYGSTVGFAWADDVESFKAARDELIYRWDLTEIDDFGVAPPLNLLPRPEPEEAERLALEHRVAVAGARTAALRDFTLEGHALWEEFQERVIEKGRMFREGPTPENLALVVSYLGWGAVTLWPEIAPPPVSGDEGAADGTTVLAGLDGAAEPQAVTEALADVAAITRRAASGQTLTPDEIDFLAAFYETLGRRVTEVPDYLARTSFDYTISAATSRTDDDSPPTYTSHTVGALDPAMVSALTAASANGMLVVSRNGPGGGGYARLPTWVRDALDDDEAYAGPPTTPTSAPVIGAGSDFEALIEFGELLDYSTIEAGTGLSHQLAIATQDLVQIGNDADLLFLEDVAGGVRTDVDSTGRTFLDVMARNDEACYDLLLDEDMPPGYDPTTFFADIYSFEWSDDGLAATGLTGVLTDDSDGTASEQERATQGLSNLVGYLTSDAESYERLMDGVGAGNPWNSALGQVNPAISQELGGLMATYMDEFGSPLSPPRGGTSPLFFATAEERLRFSTLVCSDPTAAQNLYVSVQDYTTQLLGTYPGGTSPYEAGPQVGRLAALTDAGIIAAEVDQLEDMSRMEDFGLDVLAAAGSVVPHTGAQVMLEATTALLSNAADQPIDVETPDYMLDSAERQYQVFAVVTQGLIDAGQLDGSALDAGVIDEDGQVRSVYELTGSSDSATAALATAVNDTVGSDVLTTLIQQIDIGYQAMLAGPPVVDD